MQASSSTAAPEDELAADLVSDLTRLLGSDCDASARRRAEYSTDASNYRVPPQAVVFPRNTEAVSAVVDYARRTRVPLTSRGAGTSVAGNSIGPGIVIDFSRHLNRVINIDPKARIAEVEPGVVMGQLQRLAAPHGLRFGPDPSTWARCTIGGMIGNNACGSHSLVYGRTADNVVDLDIVDGRGARFLTSTVDGNIGAPSSPAEKLVPGIGGFLTANLATIRTELGRFGRQVSGYSLEHLLPENGRSLTRTLVGTEGTCAVVLGATVKLVPRPVQPILVVLGYSGMAEAADAVPAILSHAPGAIEGLDARIVDRVRRAKGSGAVSLLPEGGGWLLIELSGDDTAETLTRAERLVTDAGAIAHRVVRAPEQQRHIWRIREDGVGLAGRTPEGSPTWPGFEDAAVPPEHLGAYLRDLEALMSAHGLSGMPYGHFGDGCIHLRLDFPLDKDGSALRSFMEAGAELVARYGGSISGEHGDGRARGELLPHMYSPRAISAFAQFKGLFDPHSTLNPGIIVDPAPLDHQLRRPAALPTPAIRGGFAFAEDNGDMTAAAHRCVGVGKCRVTVPEASGFMCPSFRATRDEKDSTRGRARVLQELSNGELVTGWNSPELHEAMDLCLSCKACASDCPAAVDIATLKAETLYRRYRGRLRPRTHYLLGWLPRWVRLAAPLAPLVNLAARVTPLRKLALRAGGMDPRREIPALARVPFHVWAKKHRSAAKPSARELSAQRSSQQALSAHTPPAGMSSKRRPRVLLWADSFSDHFSPSIPRAAITALERAGFEVVLPQRSVCCGLTWISTGQLDGARHRLLKLLDELHPFAEQGVPIVGLEPSCTAVLRSDLLELLPNDPRAHTVAAHTNTLAEVLLTRAPNPVSEWAKDALHDRSVVVQPHCHQHSVMGFDADLQLLQIMGARVEKLEGCCGLAGNFGMEHGHYEVSVAVAEHRLLPALRSATPETVFLADGFSCRTQADQLGGIQGRHLAELLAETTSPRRPEAVHA